MQECIAYGRWILLASVISARLAAAQSAPPAAAPTVASPEEEREALRELVDAAKQYEAHAQEFRTETRKIGEFRYKQRHDAATAESEAELAGLEGDQRGLRDAAIAKFEAFLKQYPDVQRYTPDAMFRLSELYFERSQEAYRKEHAEFDKQLATWDADSGAPAPEEPTLHYEPTIALMQRLITEFNDYRLIDGAYYLLGYCLGEQGEEDRSVDAFRELVARRPDSRFAPEVWTRIGEYYFNANQLDRALQAYNHVLQYQDSPYYDKALYKLAWTHYRMADPETAPQEFQKSVDMFVQLLDFNEKTRKEGKERGGDLRGESFEYMAVSYSEERWGTLDKMHAYFKALGGRPYEREAIMALGNTYFEQTRFPEAIRAYRMALEMDPDNAAAPEAQDKLVACYDKQRDFVHAAEERDRLAKMYGQDSGWHGKNQDDADALAKADKLIGKALVTAALFHHRQAQSYKDAQKTDLARAEYDKAAHAYGAFLARYPEDKQAYEYTFAYGDCLYYAGQFLASAAPYIEVRDSNNNDKLQADAAFSAVKAYENAIKAAEAAGQLKPAPVLKSSERKAAVSKQPLPELKQKYIDAIDRFAELLPKDDRAPAMLYAAAETYYAYDDYDEARERFLALIGAYPGSEVARFAANLVIESYLAQENYAAVQSFADQLLASGKIADKDFLADLGKFKSGAMFKIAGALAAKGEMEKAAEMYLKMVDDNPRGQFADSALNNAAVAYEKVKRFDSAAKVYERLVRDYPKSELADNALFRVGLNAEHFFNFDKAIGYYQQLETKYPKSPQRADAIFNAASAMENVQSYERAAQEYSRYCKLFPQRDDAPEVCFRAGAVLEKTGQWNKVIGAYQQFIHAYRNNAKHKDRVLEASLRLAKAYDKLKKPGEARKFFQETVKTFKHGPADTKSAPYAAEAEFNVVDDEFSKFRDLKITGNGKQQKATLVRKATALKKLEADYGAILKFKQIDWTLASLYRIGQLYQDFADSLVNAPCPPDVKKAAKRMGATPEEVCDEYRVLLEEKASAAEDKAVQAYETTVNRAKEFQVANTWTKQTLVALNKLRRAEWPLQKDAKVFVDTLAIGVPQVIAPPSPPGGAPADKASAEDSPTSSVPPGAGPGAS